MAIQFGGNQGEMRLVLKVKDDGSIVIDKFADNVDQNAKKSSKSFDDFAAGAGVNLRSVATYAGLAAAAVVAGGAAMIKNQIDVADATKKAAERIGTTTEALSALVYAGDLAGISQQQLEQRLLAMTRQVSDAAAGVGEARYAIKDLGLDAAKLAQLKPEDALAAIADQLDRVPNSYDKARIAADIFQDRTGSMINLLKGGSASLRELYAEAERAGKIIESDTAAAAEQFNDNVTKLKANLQGLANQTLPAVTQALLTLTDAMLGNKSEDALRKRRAELANLYVNTKRLLEIDPVYAKKRLPELLKEIDEIDAAIRSLEERKGRLASGGDVNVPSGSGSREREAADEERRKRLQEQRDFEYQVFIQWQQEQVEREAAAEQAAQAEQVRLAQGIEALQDSLLTERELIQQHLADKELLLFEAWERDIVTDQQYQQMRVQIADQAAQQRQAIEQKTTDAIRGMQASVAQNAVGLLQVYSGQSKAAAIVAITITKAMAIAQTLAHTKTAAMLAFASQLIPGDPTSIARAKVAYAATMKLGAINAALIGLQGVAEISQLGDNGAERGSAANPVHTAPAVTPFPQQGSAAPSQTVVQVIVNGNFIGNEEAAEWMGNVIKDKITNNDLILITPESRQARELATAPA